MKKTFILLMLFCFASILTGCSGSKDTFDEAAFQEDVSNVKQFYFEHSEEFNQVAACFWEDHNIECVQTASASFMQDENAQPHYTDIDIRYAGEWVDNPQEAFPSLYPAAKSILTVDGLSTKQFAPRYDCENVIEYGSFVGQYIKGYWTDIHLVFSKQSLREEEIEDPVYYFEKIDEHCYLVALEFPKV